MPNPVDELIGEWLARAEHDLRVAEFLLTMPDPPPESIGFHAQQCAEKALKAFLTLRRVRFERRHDLNYLIDLRVPMVSPPVPAGKPCPLGKRFTVETDSPTGMFPVGIHSVVKVRYRLPGSGHCSLESWVNASTTISSPTSATSRKISSTAPLPSVKSNSYVPVVLFNS